jgi:hypothetical protein
VIRDFVTAVTFDPDAKTDETASSTTDSTTTATTPTVFGSKTLMKNEDLIKYVPFFLGTLAQSEDFKVFFSLASLPSPSPPPPSSSSSVFVHSALVSFFFFLFFHLCCRCR